MTEANSNDPQEITQSLTHKFSIGSHEGNVHAEFIMENARPKVTNLKIRMARQGSTVLGLVEAFSDAVTMALAFGAPLESFCEKFIGWRFEPSGWTGNTEIPRAQSPYDYIFRWLKLRFIDPYVLAETVPAAIPADTTPPPAP